MKRPDDFNRIILIQNNDYEYLRIIESKLLELCDAAHNPLFYNKHNNDGNFYNKQHSEETKRKIGNNNRGKIHLIEQNINHSKHMKGRNVWNKGLKGVQQSSQKKTVIVDETIYNSLTEASVKLGITISAFSVMIKRHQIREFFLYKGRLRPKFLKLFLVGNG